MEPQQVNPFKVISFTRQVTLAGLNEFVRVKAAELYRDAIQNGLEIAGPVYWIYHGMDGNPSTVFTLDIALPVILTTDYSGNFVLKESGAFKYVSLVHKGNWERLPMTYGDLFETITDRGYLPSGECREIYIHIDFTDPKNNLTEVQVGIQ